MTSQAWERDVYRECPTATEAFQMGQRNAEEEWLVSVHICN